eukprot:scaffold28_cov312-Pinguiococcus_pyrenoidosus.AAC.4
MSSLTSQEERADDAPCVDCMDSAKSLKRDRMLAAASAVLAAAAFLFQRSAPVSAVALLHQMEADSPSLTAALDNGKPTIIDIYADWCDNCKSLAPVTRQLEREFGDSVNWVTVRGDAALRENQAVVRALRADAIPHYAFVRADGQVETSLIGAVPARVLRDDVKALAEGRQVPFVQFDSYRGAPSHNIRDYLGSDFFPRTARPETRKSKGVVVRILDVNPFPRRRSGPSKRPEFLLSSWASALIRRGLENTRYRKHSVPKTLDPENARSRKHSVPKTLGPENTRSRKHSVPKTLGPSFHSRCQLDRGPRRKDVRRTSSPVRLRQTSHSDPCLWQAERVKDCSGMHPSLVPPSASRQSVSLVRLSKRPLLCGAPPPPPALPAPPLSRARL